MAPLYLKYLADLFNVTVSFLARELYLVTGITRYPNPTNRVFHEESAFLVSDYELKKVMRFSGV